MQGGVSSSGAAAFLCKKANEMKNFDREFATAPMWPLMGKMALPCVAAQLVNLLYSIVDRIYIGHIPDVGADALAGVGVCSTVIILVSAFAQFVGGGGAPIASIALGQGDRDRAGRILSQGMTLLILFTVLTMLPIYLFLRPILFAVGASPATLPYAESYLSVYLVGTFFVMVNTGLAAFLNIQGRPALSMAAVSVGAGVNIVLDPILMFGAGMGVVGAAAASVISQGISAGIILHSLFSPKAALRISAGRMKPERKIIQGMLALGVSPFVMTSTESLIGLVMNSGLRSFGDIYVSALTIMQSAMQMVSIPLQGFGQGASPVLSYNYGHGDRGRVRQGARVVMTVMASYNFALFLFMILNPGLSARIFTSDPALIAVVRRVMPVFLLGMTIFGLQRACQNTFVALNQAKISVFIALLRKVFLLVPLALILPHFFGVMGIYGAEAVADGTAAVICTLLFVRRFPRILAGMDSAAENEMDGAAENEKEKAER